MTLNHKQQRHGSAVLALIANGYFLHGHLSGEAGGRAEQDRKVMGLSAVCLTPTLSSVTFGKLLNSSVP